MLVVPFTFLCPCHHPMSLHSRTQRFLQGPFAPGADLCSRTLAVSPDGKLLFSGGHWDNSLRVTSLGKGKVIGHITRHIGTVSLSVGCQGGPETMQGHLLRLHLCISLGAT